jgi:hypothetical protein
MSIRKASESGDRVGPARYMLPKCANAEDPAVRGHERRRSARLT